MHRMWIGLEGWIIADGNYGNFHVGQEVRFALEFYPRALASTPTSIRSLQPVQRNRYQFCGPVVHRSREEWIIDPGILAYQKTTPPAEARAGAWLEGELDLGVDPFFYFEQIAKQSGVPALMYPWRIEGILLETTPWLSKHEPGGPTTMWRDESQESFVEVGATDAWNDDGGLGFYLLECTRIGTPSRP